MTNSSFFRGRQKRCMRVKDGASLFLWSHPWKKKRQQGADHSGAGSRHLLCPLLKHQQCLGDKLTLPGQKPCPASLPLFLWGNWGNGGALGQGRGLCSGEGFFQQQRLLVGGCCSPFPGPCAGMPWLPLLCSCPGSLAQRNIIGLRSGHLPLQLPLLWFFSVLNSSLPHLGAG